MHIPDNYDLFERHEAKRERWLRKRPVCCECGERIEDDHAYRMEGGLLCPSCFEEWADDIKMWLED